jgi:hypothetical protein
MNVAATDNLGIITSIVVVDDAWWASAKDAAIALLEGRGFDFYDIGPINPGEAERNISGWPEWDAWVATLRAV